MAMVMKMISSMAILIIPLAFRAINVSAACSNGQCQLRDECSSNKDCAKGLYCLSCPVDFKGSRCVRSITSNPFNLLNNSLPFNKYAFLTTHNSFAIRGEPSHTGVPRITATNQEDNVTQQLNGGIWLCHSFKGKCHDITAFEPLMDTLKEIEAFMTANPSEIITLILEDHVKAPNGLSKLFNSSGLNKFWFPVSKMPKGGRDWPLVKDMVADNQRLIVFTSDQSKQESEGIAYQWNFVVENQFGNGGLKGNCTNRKESVPMNDKDKSLVLVNHFGTLPARGISCDYNSKGLMEMLDKCYTSAGNRWANFVAVDYYKRSDGGGAFEAVDKLNGEMLCGCGDVRACVVMFSRS
ncbi:PI-PLC X domain-containing protein At5g67130 [Linum perenne]